MRKKGAKSDRDAFIARVAARQHGVVSTEQLRSAGISFAGIDRRINAARLYRVHRGVYAVGHPTLSERGRWMAAVLACGEGAVLSHLSAAELWGIRRLSDAGGDGEVDSVHITVPGTGGRKRRNGIVLHRSSTLIAGDCTRRHGIPVTKPTRTLADIRPLLSAARFNAAVREAEFLDLPVDQDLVRGRPASLQAARTHTELEAIFLGLCRRHRLPQPEVNVKIDRFEVDFLWCEQRLVVEVDGWESHRTRSAFEEDRRRDVRLKVLGYEVMRFTWRQVEYDAREVAAAIRTLLALAAE